MAAPSLAVLLIAACSAPGWLWSAEFDGYDALSYHLELPREWLAREHVSGLRHNVYSFLPNYVEAAYAHLAVFRRDAVLAGEACQLLHAAFSILTALTTGALATRHLGRMGGAVAAVIVLTTPWVVVVGSMAYDEMAVSLLLAGGLLILDDEHFAFGRGGAAIGWVAGIATGAKLTSAGLAALPLVALLLLRTAHCRGPRAPLLAGAAAGAAALLALSPWLLGNLLRTGNPLFPFAGALLGYGHWTAEQAAIWSAGHGSGQGAAGRLLAAWNQLLRFGLGSRPDGMGTWQPLWSVLPWLALLSLPFGLRAPRFRRWSSRLALVLGLQASFWLFFTHLQSRFMIPAVVPAALAVGLGSQLILDSLVNHARWRVLFEVFLGGALLVSAVLPVAIFREERSGAPAAMIGGADLRRGDRLTESQRSELEDRWPEIFVNYRLPQGARVLMVGEAAPLYYQGSFDYQTTWDRGPLSRIMREQPDDPAAWMQSLRRAGYTHLLVNRVMLEIWEHEGWNDPLITAARVIGAAEAHARTLQTFPGGTTIYALGDDAAYL